MDKTLVIEFPPTVYSLHKGSDDTSANESNRPFDTAERVGDIQIILRMRAVW